MKTTIYVPDALVDRITKLKENGVTLNISGICQEAIEQQVDVAERSDRGLGLGKVLRRLEITKAPSELTEMRGAAMGRRWASDTASEQELRSLKDIKPLSIIGRGGMPEDSITYTSDGRPRYSVGYVYGSYEDGETESIQLPETVPAEDLAGVPDDQWLTHLRAFILGATEVYGRVVEARALLARVEELQELRSDWYPQSVDNAEMWRPWQEVHGDEYDLLVAKAAVWGLQVPIHPDDIPF